MVLYESELVNCAVFLGIVIILVGFRVWWTLANIEDLLKKLVKKEKEP